MADRRGYLTPDLPTPASKQCWRFRIPDDPTLIANFFGAVLELAAPYNWEKFGTMTPQQAADIFQAVYFDCIDNGGGCLIGTIFPFITATLPSHALECIGGTYLRVTYPDLYAVLDAAFIIDADHFTLPDLRDNVVIGAGGTYSVAQTGGEAQHTLTTAEMPNHTHVDTGHAHAEGTAAPNATTIGAGAPQPTAIPSVGVTGAGSASLTNTGGGGAHNNIQPFQALRWGVFYE